MKNAPLVLLGAALVFAAGWWLGRRSAVEVAPVERMPAAEEETASAPLPPPPSAEVAITPSVENDEPDPPARPVDFWTRVGTLTKPERLRLAALMKAQAADFAIPRMLDNAWSHKGGPIRLDDAFCAAFELSASERNQLEQALEAARQDIGGFERNFAESRLSEDGQSLVITVPPFPLEGGRVYDRLLGQFSAVMTEGRKAVFDAIYDRSIDNLFEGMGTKEREVTVTLEPVSSSAELGGYYKVMEAWRSDQGNGHTSSVLTWADVQTKLGALGTLLPPTEPGFPPGG